MEPKKALVIGGQDYTLAELYAFPVTDLAELIVEYQDTRRTWQAADDAIAAFVAALEAEIEGTKRAHRRRNPRRHRHVRRRAKARTQRKEGAA